MHANPEPDHSVPESTTLPATFESVGNLVDRAVSKTGHFAT